MVRVKLLFRVSQFRYIQVRAFNYTHRYEHSSTPTGMSEVLCSFGGNSSSNFYNKSLVNLICVFSRVSNTRTNTCNLSLKSLSLCLNSCGVTFLNYWDLINNKDPFKSYSSLWRKKIMLFMHLDLLFFAFSYGAIIILEVLNFRVCGLKIALGLGFMISCANMMMIGGFR